MFSAGPPGSWKQLSGDSDALASIYTARWPRPLLGVTMRRGLVRLIFVSPYSGKVLQDRGSAVTPVSGYLKQLSVPADV